MTTVYLGSITPAEIRPASELKFNFWMLPDPLLPPFHPDYPVRRVAPNPCVFSPSDLEDTTGANSPACRFDEPWQWFAMDLLSGAAFGQMVGDLGALLALGRAAFYFLSDPQFESLAQCFDGTFSSGVAFCNRKGTPSERFPDPHKNYIRNKLDGDYYYFSKAIRCGTDTIRGSIVTNSKNWKMIKVDSFIYKSGPPPLYDLSILADPRVAYASIIYSGGAVGNFPPRGGLPVGIQIPYPYVTTGPTFYPLWYCQQYDGPRRPIGYRPTLMQSLFNYIALQIRARGL